MKIKYSGNRIVKPQSTVRAIASASQVQTPFMFSRFFVNANQYSKKSQYFLAFIRLQQPLKKQIIHEKSIPQKTQHIP